jgi:hypothetical protein
MFPPACVNKLLTYPIYRFGFTVFLAALNVVHISSSTSAEILAQYGIELREVSSLGLNSKDLQDLGVTDVIDRISILRDAKKNGLNQDFAFVASYVNTRQYGKCIHVVVRYRYPGTMDDQKYIDNREIRDRGCGTRSRRINTRWKCSGSL